MKAVYIESNRNGYSPDQCGRTMTVGELIKYLRGFDKKSPVYTRNDKGYTYGNIRSWDIIEADTDIDTDEEDDWEE